MHPTDFKGSTHVVARNQPPYHPLPVSRIPGDPLCRMTSCWRLSWRERVRVLLTGRVWHQTCTFGAALQPFKLIASRPL